MRELFLPDPEATHALGLSLGRALHPGQFIALRGDLGAGKSALARGIARGLGIKGPIPSPTYCLVSVYEAGRLPLIHADWYRLGGDDELTQLGWDDWDDGHHVRVVEWSERCLGALPSDHLTIELVDEGEGRRARIHATGPLHAGLEHV